MAVVEVVAVEDADNVRDLLLHYLGNPYVKDDEGRPLGMVDQRSFEWLEQDILRYCTRLRCQPNTYAHMDYQGYHIPAHKVIGGRR